MRFVYLLLTSFLLACSALTPRWPQRARRTPAVLWSNPSPVTAALPERTSTPDPRTLNGLLTKTTTARELLELHAQYGSAFNHVNLATCWSRLGRVRAGGERRWLLTDDDARLDALREQTRERLRTFGAREVSNTAHTLAKLALLGAAWASLWNEIERAALARRSEFGPQELASTAWAFATAGHAAPALFDAIAEEASGRMRELNPQDLANTAWAFAKAGHAAPALFEAIAEEASGRVREFTPQALTNAAWAFATAGHAAPALFDAIAAEAAGRVRELNQQDLANTAWAFATVGHAAPALFDAIAEEAARRVGELNPQVLANTAWAFATAGHAAPALFDTIAEEAAGRVRELNPQDLANTAWAFAEAGHTAPALFEAIAVEAAGRVRELNPQNLANTAWAFATAGHAALALFKAIAEEAAGRVREFTPQALANTAWAYAASDHYAVESSLFDQRFARRCDALAHEFNSKDLNQLHQWRLWYACEQGCSDGLPEAALLARCDAAFRASEVTVSRLQRQVAEMLVLLGASVQEVVLQEGYSLDLVVDWRGERLAVEVDGPSHFVGREPTGATLLKRRQLEHFGWWLVSVPYWEWDELSDKKTTREQRAAYLSKLLEAALRAPALSSGVQMEGREKRDEEEGGRSGGGRVTRRQRKRRVHPTGE